MRSRLAISIVAFNSERTIERVLESVAPLEADIQVVDSGSTDRTLEICEKYGAKILHRAWDGPCAQNEYSFNQLTDYNWTLSLDSDEIIDEELREHIREVVDDEGSEVNGWELTRKLEFLGAELNHAFFPEWKMRLFRSDQVTVTGMGRDRLGGHNKYIVPGELGRLRGVCLHASWDSVSAMFHSYVRYGTRHASYVGTGGKLSNVLFNPLVCFFKYYCLKQGFRDGVRGFLVCIAAAIGNLQKHLMVYADRKTGYKKEAPESR